jgi:dihydroneopterin aldolase
MTDRITLTGLRVRGHHGVLATERRAGQDFVVDVSLDLDLAPAASSDDVADTVDYGALAEALATVISGEPVNLLETLADARVATATVTVRKPQAPIRLNFDDVSVTMRRGRS